MNKTKLVISRSGYSTILDLAVIGTKALMIPTPGQVEQEYLAKYHKNKNSCHSINQDEIHLKKDIIIAEKTNGFSAKKSVENAVENVLQIIQT